MQQIKPISNFVSIDEQKQALYYEFMNKKSNVSLNNDDDIKDKNSYTSITNKLNIITDVYNKSKVYTSKTFKNSSNHITDVFRTHLNMEMVLFYSNIPTNKRSLVYDDILKSMYPYVTYNEPPVFKPIKLRTIKTDKIIIRNKRPESSRN